MSKSMRPGETDRPGVDWRAWITLAWALFWGAVYFKMVLEVRGQRVLEWFKPRHSQVVLAPVEPEQPRSSHPSITTVIGPHDRE
jgi:hypothetical protein